MTGSHSSAERAGIRLLIKRLRRDSLLRNSTFIMATTVVTSALGYAYWLIAAHLYPPNTVGLAAALVSAMTLSSVVCTFGIQASLFHRMALRRSGPEWSATLNAALTAAGALSAAGGVAVVFALPLFSSRFDLVQDHPAYAIAFAFGVVLTTLSTVVDYMFIAERSADQMLLRNTFFSVAKVALVAAPVVFAASGALAILGSWVIASLGGVAISFVLVRRIGRSYRFGFRSIVGEMRALLPALPGHHITNVAGGLPMFALPLLVAAELSTADNAYFYTAWMVGSIFFIISPAVSWALFAEGTRRGADLGQVIRRSAVITGSLLLPLMLVALASRHLVLSMFGSGYAAHGAELLAILVISAIPDAITNIYVSVMRVRDLLGRAAALNVSMALETIVLAWILLPRLGIAGAGWAWLIAQTSGALVVLAHGTGARAAHLFRSFLQARAEGHGA